jgi:hypothetical protein
MSDNLRKAGSYEGNDRNYGTTDGSEELVEVRNMRTHDPQTPPLR